LLAPARAQTQAIGKLAAENLEQAYDLSSSMALVSAQASCSLVVGVLRYGRIVFPLVAHFHCFKLRAAVHEARS
jgi:hypothetical protein